MAAEGERVRVGRRGRKEELPSLAEGTNNRPRNGRANQPLVPPLALLLLGQHSGQSAERR